MMETQESTAQVALGKGIDAAKLERELNAMWAEMSAPEGEGSAAGVVRACVLNLVVYAEGAAERAEVDDLLSEVVERHPCRAIVLAAEREADDASLEAFVSTRCQLSSRGSKRICGEQITIEAAGAAVDTASSAVEPLLVPDVPVFLWWKDRPHYDLRRLAGLLEGGRMRLSDLNWGRLTSWRELVAGFWDVADYRDSLARIERIVIEYDPPDSAHGEIA